MLILALNQVERLDALLGAMSRQYNSNGLDHDQDIEPDRKMPDIVEVVFEFFANIIDARNVSLIDLSPSGNARANHVAIAVEGDFTFVPFGQVERLWPWANPAHFTSKNIPDLRQLIDPGLADKVTDPGYPVIIRLRHIGVLGPAAFILNTHRPEFIDSERAAPISHAGLFEQGGSLAVEPDPDTKE